jgi:crossover junction endodeoxyribonuclease RusA
MKAKKAYRMKCWATVGTHLNRIIGDGPLMLELTFYRPTRRSYDRDNLLARMKSGLDGVCDALHIDDKRFTTVVVRVAEEIGNYVEVKISEETK